MSEVSWLSVGSPHTRGDVPWTILATSSRATFSPHAWGCSFDFSHHRLGRHVLPTRVGMFRTAPPAPSAPGGSPHTRGDVPSVSGREKNAFWFSPHAWGCSALSPSSGLTHTVLPTRVGMFRSGSCLCRYYLSSPHTRGDVPRMVCPLVHLPMFSPHAWGCSERMARRAGRPSVLPTRVGMFRGLISGAASWWGSPHTRGDVPFSVYLKHAIGTFSPHAWGCSVLVVLILPLKRVLPTRVGMFRNTKNRRAIIKSSPHTRGDVPSSALILETMGSFSPHAWGCSGLLVERAEHRRVLPTCVGMFRRIRTGRPACRCSPHTRGDVPHNAEVTTDLATFSPHAWGCSEQTKNLVYYRFVLPTRVGMFRDKTDESKEHQGSPHTRGDVPFVRWPSCSFIGFSPHAWGCSDHLRTYEADPDVLPTRVGMFRRMSAWSWLAWRSPHTRGDVPGLPGVQHHGNPFSPHAWGCSVMYWLR